MYEKKPGILSLHGTATRLDYLFFGLMVGFLSGLLKMFMQLRPDIDYTLTTDIIINFTVFGIMMPISCRRFRTAGLDPFWYLGPWVIAGSVAWFPPALMPILALAVISSAICLLAPEGFFVRKRARNHG